MSGPTGYVADVKHGIHGDNETGSIEIMEQTFEVKLKPDSGIGRTAERRTLS